MGETTDYSTRQVGLRPAGVTPALLGLAGVTPALLGLAGVTPALLRNDEPTTAAGGLGRRVFRLRRTRGAQNSRDQPEENR